MANNVSFRSNGFIWAVRIIQLIFAIALLGVAGSDASSWHDLDCSTPSKLAYHIAMASITLFPLVYFLLTTGPVALTKFWHPWLQICLDALFVVFWIVAAALSSYDCDGLCSSCSVGGREVDEGYGFNVWAGSLFCYCVFPDDEVATDSESKLFLRAVPKSSSGSSGASKALNTAEKATSIAVKKELDAAMIFLFFVTLLTAIYLKYGSSAARAQAAANTDAAKEEAHVGNDIDMNQTYVNA